ncbi:MAG TPA: NAD(P)/FAD-dependent oxidoreductase [Actinomycetota bacterium]|nr:NAD(P)/FAD-dependent oxidoreductase [Actinomycetota bacterium]
MPTYDAVVVGARCAGAIAAGQLARQGWKVLMIDKDQFPSDTVSTHFMFPNTVARLDGLGIFERLQASHEIPALSQIWRILGYELKAEFSPIEGISKGLSVRRITLDSVLIDWARDLGAETRFGSRVEGLVGAGTDDDPVRGVVLEDGEEIVARWVIGADGRASTVASLLNLEKEKTMSGDTSFLFAYWRGLPDREFASLDIHGDRSALMWNACEDGIHLLSLGGPPELTRGTGEERMKAYQTGIRNYPEVIAPGVLDSAEQISDLVVVPEAMMRGFYRRSNGPGWVLVGDAGHFKHPGTAQGISDAIEQSVYVAEALQADDAGLTGFSTWRRDRTKGHYEWSFRYGTWPVEEVARPYLEGLSSDPAATQDWFDVLTRLKRPSDVETPERLGAWFGSG